MMATEEIKHNQFEADFELGRRMITGSFGHLLLMMVVLIFSDLKKDFPKTLYICATAVIATNIARFLLGKFQKNLYQKSPRVWSFSFLALLVMTSIAWGVLCAVTINHYGIAQYSSAILLLVTAGIAAGSANSLIPNFSYAVVFLTLLMGIPFFELQRHSDGGAFSLIFLVYFSFLIAQLKSQGREYHRNLEQKKELMNSNTALDAATKVKSEFLATMSHEIRTPLNGIIGMNNLLFSENLTPQGRDYLRIMKNCGETLLVLINDILDFSKMEAGKLTLEDVTFNVNKTIRDVVEMFSLRAKDKGIDLIFNSKVSDSSWVIADSTRFQQVLNNLISNAIKFTPKGSVIVEANLAQKNPVTNEILISVKDSGLGIDEHVKSKLFQSFSQADASTTRRYGGTGLGLAICKGICEAMWGTIWVDTKKGFGSTFSFTILAKTATAEQIEEQKPHAIDPELGTKYPLNILVADDNSTNRILACRFFDLLGYKVDVAGNGLEVLDCVGQKNYDIIFMDGHMPEMDGFVATKKIHERFAPEKRPWVTALTAGVTENDKKKCWDAGMDDFVAKPFSALTLCDAVIRFIEKKHKTKVEVKTQSVSPVESVKTDSLFSLQKMENHFAGDEQIMMGFMSNYLDEYETFMTRLQNAINNKELKNLLVISHTLKGLVANFFVRKDIHESLALLEDLGHSPDWVKAEATFKNCKPLLDNLKMELVELIQRRKAA